MDGTPTEGRDLDDVLTEVRGEAGTKVDITVQADGTGPERTYTITRADVALEPVTWTMVPGTDTALLYLDSFSTGSADAVVKALGEIKTAGADRLIFDLRGNPGGYVNEAVKIASQFLSEGVVYIDRDANGNETPQKVTPGGVALDIPLVVLVDQNTASSSEIVSGALQDAGRAEIVGVTTFGTGTVLGEFELSDKSALRIGTVEWLTPKGRQIWHNGITPDVVVERPSDVQPLFPDAVRDLTAAEVKSIDDPQLAKALELSPGPRRRDALDGSSGRGPAARPSQAASNARPGSRRRGSGPIRAADASRDAIMSVRWHPRGIGSACQDRLALPRWVFVVGPGGVIDRRDLQSRPGSRGTPSSGSAIVSVPPSSAATGFCGFALSTCSAGGLPVLRIA